MCDGMSLGTEWTCAHLVGDDKDEGVGAVDGLEEVGLGDDVVAEVDTGEVLDVLVLLVDDLGQLAPLELMHRVRIVPVSPGSPSEEKGGGRTHVLLVAPHLDLGVKVVAALLDVLADEAGDRRPPVAAPCGRIPTVSAGGGSCARCGNVRNR